MKDMHVSKSVLKKCIDKMFKPNKEFYKWWKVKKEKDDEHGKSKKDDVKI